MSQSWCSSSEKLVFFFLFFLSEKLVTNVKVSPLALSVHPVVGS